MGNIPPEKRKLNTNQQKAVVHGTGPLLIIAGAGSGKTTVITERITYLLAAKKALPEEILALTFTEKASHEMEARVEEALPYGAPHMWISTFHAFCDRVLRADGLHIGINPGYTVMTEAETIQFFRKYLFTIPLDYFRPLGNPTKFIRGLIQHFSRLKDEDVSSAAYAKWVKSHTFEDADDKKKYEELSRVFTKYEELKVKDGVCDYSDLISYTLDLFRKRNNILTRYQRQFKYILVDEFQDTNFAQNEIAILLAGKKKNITVVGDDDQAIYRWRGAAISNIIQFRKRFTKAKIVVLTQNYRSTRQILDSSYTLIQNNNPDRLEVVEHIDKKLKNVRDITGVPVTVLYADRVENEADMVLTEIEKLKNAQGSKLLWSDFAVLVRANAHADPFVRALSRKGIPYQFLGPGQLFRQSEVKDLIAYMKLLVNYEDSVAAYRVLTLDILGINPRDIAGIVSYARKNNDSYIEVCEHIAGYGAGNDSENTPEISKDGFEKIQRFVAMFHKHLGLIKKETAGQIMYYFLQESGLFKQFATYKTEKEERIASNIAKFFDKLKSYETEHEDASMFAVCEWIELSMDIGESPQATNIDWSQNDAVNILTVHSSKGLEFPVVFLVNLVGARFPTMDKKEQIPIPDELVKEVLPVGDSHIEEERRLFYVGMTRARDYLYLTAAQYYGEGKREKKVSPFIAETIGKHRFAHEMMPKTSEVSHQIPLIEWEKKEEKDGMPVRSPVTYISYTQLSTFVTCPLQYKYRYVVRIPVLASAALVFGDTIHKTLCSFYEKVQNKEKPSVKTLLDVYETQWQKIKYGGREYEEKMKKRGIDLLREYYDKGYDKSSSPKSLEQPFKIKITPTLFLGGKIDRVDENTDGSIEIIDYKTGQAPKAKNVSRDEQLTAYALAACDPGLYNMPPEKVTVSLYFLEGNTKVSATRTKKEIDEMRELIEKRAGEISTSPFLPTAGKHCDFCEFKLICEAWQ